MYDRSGCADTIACADALRSNLWEVDSADEALDAGRVEANDVANEAKGGESGGEAGE